MLRVQLHTPFAQVPKENPDGSYTIFSSEKKELFPLQTMAVATDISMVAPTEWGYLFESGSLLTSFQIQTMNYTSLNDREAMVKSSEPRPTRLILYLHNNSELPYLIHPGDEIARLRLISIKQFPVTQVENIMEAFNQSSPIEAPKIKALPKTAMVWFKHLYVDDSALVNDRYLTNPIKQALQQFKATDPMYLGAINKTNVEANYVWKLLPKEIRVRIQEDFAELKTKSLDTPQPQPVGEVTTPVLEIPEPIMVVTPHSPRTQPAISTGMILPVAEESPEEDNIEPDEPIEETDNL